MLRRTGSQRAPRHSNTAIASTDSRSCRVGLEQRGKESAISSSDNTLVRSYLALRRGVGLLGVALPVILMIGVLLLDPSQGWQDTISDYIGTVMRGVFVGVLFAIGVFLFFYVGYEPSEDKKAYEPSDNLAGNLACVFALGVALFPTNSSSGLVRTVHFVSATALFLSLAYFSLRLFTKTNDRPTPQKMIRNRIFRVCGVIILVCIALIGLNGWLFRDASLAAIKPVFWLESIALWAFGWAWFVKGEGLSPLNDA